MASVDITDPELISDDPRREPDIGPEWIERAIRAATEEFGPLIPRSLGVQMLGVSHQAVSEYLRRGSLTGVSINGHDLIPLSQIMTRIERKRTGQQPRGGRPKRTQAA